MKPTVVFVHGVGLDATMWDDVVAQMRDDFICIAVDMAGHGARAYPAADALSGYVDALEQSIAVHTDAPIHLVGFSMGAMVAAAYALKRPDQVSRLVMMNAIYQRDAAAREAVLRRLEAVKDDGLNAVADTAIARWFSEAFMKNNPDVIHKIRERLITNHLDSYQSAYRVFATADEDLAPRLTGITCPVLAVTADGDGNSTPAMSQDIADGVYDGRVVIWDGLAHGAPIEAPRRVAETLKDFFKKE